MSLKNITYVNHLEELLKFEDEIINSIDGMNETFATLIKTYINNYIAMSNNKLLAANNIIQQIKTNLKKISVEQLENINGNADQMHGIIKINSDIDRWLLDNTFMHELTHIIASNNDIEDNYTYNLGLKANLDDKADQDWGIRLKNWEIDGNNYAYNKGNILLDEWITEWLANKISGFVNSELREDTNGFFRKKTCHGYDGSNAMNLMELVYGSENIANLITGFDLSEEERKQVIPLVEIKKLDMYVDSKNILLDHEVILFKSFQPPYMQNPTIFGLISYYASEYQKQDTLETHNIYLQKILDVLVRAYNYQFTDKIKNCNNEIELNDIYTDLSIIQNSIMWSEDNELLKSLESYRLFDKMRNEFLLKSKSLNIENDYGSLFLTSTQLKEKFRLEEEYIKYSYKGQHSSSTII